MDRGAVPERAVRSGDAQAPFQYGAAEVRHGLGAGRRGLGQPGVDDADAARHGEGFQVTAVLHRPPGGKDRNG